MDTTALAADAQPSQSTPSSEPAWKANLAKAQSAGRDFWKNLTPEQRAAQIEKMKVGRKAQLKRKVVGLRKSAAVSKKKAAKIAASIVSQAKTDDSLATMAMHLEILAGFCRQLAALQPVINAINRVEEIGGRFEDIHVTASIE